MMELISPPTGGYGEVAYRQDIFALCNDVIETLILGVFIWETTVKVECAKTKFLGGNSSLWIYFTPGMMAQEIYLSSDNSELMEQKMQSLTEKGFLLSRSVNNPSGEGKEYLLLFDVIWQQIKDLPVK